MASTATLVALLFGLSLAAFALEQAALPPFYVISHMANTPKAVSWSMAQGANALELDIRFNDDGSVKEFRHGGVCDCTCSPHCLPLGGQEDICSPLGCSCEASSDAITMFNFLAVQPGLALILLDSKVDGTMSESLLAAAGRGIVDAVNKELFGKGYQGNVVISAGKADAMTYIQSASNAAGSSRWSNKIFHAFDQTGGSASNAFCSLNVANRLDRPNIVYGTGISACAPTKFHDALKVGVANRDQGAVGLAYIWTIDKEKSMRDYLKLRPDGILSNRPGLLLKVAKSMGYKLATVSTPITIPYSNVTGGNPASCPCDCDYHPGGCRISLPSPRNTSCKCKYRPLQWTCSGSVVKCRDEAHSTCLSPDSSATSCQNGGGDCKAYR